MRSTQYKLSYHHLPSPQSSSSSCSSSESFWRGGNVWASKFLPPGLVGVTGAAGAGAAGAGAAGARAAGLAGGDEGSGSFLRHANIDTLQLNSPGFFNTLCS